jgi:exportin-7
LLEEFSAEQMMVDPNMPPEAFLYILQACEQGVESNDSFIRTHACSTINSICTFVIGETEKAELRHNPEKKEMEKKKSQGSPQFLNYIVQFPQVLPKLLTTLFGLILFDDNNDQWQLSRPLYSLVLLERDVSKTVVKP